MIAGNNPHPPRVRSAPSPREGPDRGSRAKAGKARQLLTRIRQRAFRFAPADRAPVVLHHSRIYILPTRRGLAVIATLLLMLLTSLNYALSLGLAVTFLLGGLIASTLLHAFRNLAGIEIKPLAASDAFAGSNIVFSLSLAAGSVDRRGIAISANDVTVTTAVTAGQLATVTLAVPVPARGRMALGRVTLSSTQPLALWRAFAYVHFPLAGIAYPTPETSPPPLPAGEYGFDARAQGRGDESDLAGLRDYQRGDPLQHVAWKAVARGAGWFSKAFEGNAAGGPVALEWSKLPLDLDVEARLSRLTAWVLDAERAARPFALSLPGRAFPAATDAEHRRRVLTALALYPEAPA